MASMMATTAIPTTSHSASPQPLLRTRARYVGAGSAELPQRAQTPELPGLRIWRASKLAR